MRWGFPADQTAPNAGKKLLLRLDLPEHLSANAMLDALNLLVERAELEAYCKALFGRQEAGDPPL